MAQLFSSYTYHPIEFGDLSVEKGGRTLTDETKIDVNEHWVSAQQQPMVEPPKCDVDKYRDHIKDFDLSEAERVELLKTIWLIMAAFVDLGFGVDSIQILSSSDEKQPEPLAHGVNRDDEQVNSKGVIDVE